MNFAVEALERVYPLIYCDQFALSDKTQDVALHQKRSKLLTHDLNVGQGKQKKGATDWIGGEDLSFQPFSIRELDMGELRFEEPYLKDDEE